MEKLKLDSNIDAELPPQSAVRLGATDTEFVRTSQSRATEVPLFVHVVVKKTWRMNAYGNASAELTKHNQFCFFSQHAYS